MTLQARVIRRITIGGIVLAGLLFLPAGPVRYWQGWLFLGRQRLGSISKQGNPMMRSLLVEAGHTAARLDPELRQDYQRLKLRRGGGVAKIAIARKLAVRMYWMLRSQASYAQLVRMQGSPRATLVKE